MVLQVIVLVGVAALERMMEASSPQSGTLSYRTQCARERKREKESEREREGERERERETRGGTRRRGGS